MTREFYGQNGQHRGQASITASGNFRRPAINIEGQHRVWENKNGGISVGGGASKIPGSSHWNPHVGVTGSFRFRRSPEPKDRGQVTITAQGDPRRPNINVDAQKKIWENRHGSISVGGGADKRPGSSHWNPHVGVTGSFRF